MPLELIEDAFGDNRNAVFLALASDLAYMNQADGDAAFKEKLGLAGTLLSVGNTQVWVLGNDDHIVLAFRGTEAPTSIEGLRDWLLTDAANLLILPEGRLGTDLVAAGVGARFHMGFANALADIWEPTLAALKAELAKKDRPVWITGHSLGGALAQLATWMCLRSFINVHQLYTYGGPMIGNAEANAAFDKAFDGKIFRYVGAEDPVPLLPTLSLVANGYAHCNKEVTLGATASGAASWISALASKTADGVMSGTLLNDVWAAVQARVAAHGLDSYRSHIEKMS